MGNKSYNIPHPLTIADSSKGGRNSHRPPGFRTILRKLGDRPAPDIIMAKLSELGINEGSITWMEAIVYSLLAHGVLTPQAAKIVADIHDSVKAAESDETNSLIKLMDKFTSTEITQIVEAHLTANRQSTVDQSDNVVR